MSATDDSSARGERAEGEITSPAKRAQARKAYDKQPGAGGASSNAASSSSSSTAAPPPAVPTVWSSNLPGTHLYFSSPPSLSLEMLRQSMSEYLRTQVCSVHLVVVLYGFNDHDYGEDEEIPINEGRLCYVCLTQSEMILVDKSSIGFLASSVVIPSYDDLLPPVKKKKGATVINVPYYFIEELIVDPEREDFFQLLIREKSPRPLPTSFILSSVHRKAISENLQAMYNNHFLYASVWNSDIMPHPYVGAAEANRAVELEKWQKALALKRKKKAAEKADKDPDDVSTDEEDDESDKPLTGNYSVLTLSASGASTTGQIPTLPITFQDSEMAFQHPSEQFFEHLPPRYENTTRFHRCGYVWSTNAGWSALDTGSSTQAYLNRSTGTYIYKHPDDESTHISYANRKQLLVTFLPELSVSTHTSLLQCRDAKGSVYGRKCGKMSLKELLRYREESHDTDFFMWCESVGRSVAMHSAANAASPLPVHDLAAAIDPVSPPSSPQLSFQIPPLASTQPQPPHIPPPDYFVAQSIIHTRKVNVVGDKATVICFKMHCYTSEREIGLVGIRRKFIPPCCDTFQDILFVMYGPAVAPGEPLQPNPNFMYELESMVDTLSPTVVPLPYHYAQRPDLKMIHPTYVDPLVMQARMNALLYSQSAYSWFQTRRWIHSTYLYNPRIKGARNDHHNQESGLVPTMEFLGAAGYKLAVGFANAILVRVSHREERQAWSERMANVVVEGIGPEAQFENEQMILPNEGVGGGAKEEAKTDNEGLDKNASGGGANGTKGVNTASLAARALLGDMVRQSAVDDPMDIVERMCTEFFAYENAMRENGMKPAVQKTTYSAEEEWRCRVSQYLAYAVDDGIFPSALNIRRLLNVITGNMVKAPLISYETANKLEKVVDFLLYLKKRCGTPLQLPSLWSEEKAAVAAQANSLAAKLKPNNKRQHEIATVFARIASTAPAAVSSDGGKPAGYDWDSKTSLLHKFRDIGLMLNFTCNENVMVHLLDANYVEYLENAALGTSDHSDLSVLPQLLTSLLQKDYNIALVRAVCDKIIVNQIQYDGFIPALLALARDGSLYASIYSLRALTFLARTFPLVIYEYGGVSIGMWHICYSKNEDLLDAAIDMVLELVTNQNIHIFGQSGFIKKLVDILRPRVGLQLRYRSALLQKTCSLILKFAQVPSLLTLCLTHYCHKELIDILAKSHQYQPILLHVTACMGQLYVNAGSQIMGAPSEKMVEDATILVRSLNAFNSREQLRLCLNILIVLQYLLRLPKGYYARLSNTKHNKVTGAIQFTPPDPAFEKRMNVLQHLTQDESLDTILDDLLKTALNEEERTERELQLSGTIQIIDGRKVVTSSPEEMQAGQKDDWLLGRRMVAKNVKEKTKWFRTRINFSKTADFNVKAIWQKDNNKQFLAIPKV